MTNAERDALILEHLPKVQAIVNRIAVRLPSHIDVEDLVNTGVLGLMDAIGKYDPEQGVTLTTYAEYRITGAILDQLRSSDWVPRSVRQKGRRLDNASRQITNREGRPATPDEMAEFLKVGIDEFHRLVKETVGIEQVNLDLADRWVKTPKNEAELAEKQQFCEKAIEKLNPQERLVIRFYFYQDKTLREIGQILRLTEGRICQIHCRAIAKLQKAR